MRFRPILIYILCAVIIFGTAAFYSFRNKDNSGEKSKDKLIVCTSIYPMYEFAKNICGEEADVKCMVPEGVDYRQWKPSATEMALLDNANIFIYSGKNSETWIDEVLEYLKNKNVKIVEASKNIPTVDNMNYPWLNPKNALIQMTAMYDAVKQADPENEVVYNLNMNIFTDKVNNLDLICREEIGKFRKKDIYVTNDVYDDFFAEYGLSQKIVKGISKQGIIMDNQINELKNFINQNKVICIFAESEVDTYNIEEIVEPLGVTVEKLDPIVVNKENGGYFDTMESNLLVLKRGQKAPINQ